jgi:hypothetical protein
MDFIEQLLHISPDGGSGATEFFIVAALAAVVFAIVCRRQLLALMTHRKAGAEHAAAPEQVKQ